MAKQFLFNDFSTYNYYFKLETEVKEIFNQIEALVLQALGNTSIDYVRLFNNVEYLTEEYISKYRPDAPKHLSKSIFESETKVTTDQLQTLLTAFNVANGKLSIYPLKVVKGGVKSTLSKPKFDKYLNPDKRAKYEALVEFLTAVKELGKYENVPIDAIMKCSQDLVGNGLEVEIQNSRFL